MNLRPTLALLFAACLCAPMSRAGESASPFTNDLDAARKQAKAGHKDILVDFTGSNWCGWCIALDREVFHDPEFKAKAPAHFELVQLDFPNPSTLPKETEARNKKWQAELKSGSFPDVLLLDENGLVYANTGYRAGGAKVYLEHLESLRGRRILRDQALALAEKAEGLERAKHLDAALSALRDDQVLLAYYGETIKQIAALDAQDKAGLRTKYKALFARQQCKNDITQFCIGDDGAAMLAKMKAYADKPGLQAESRQYALFMAGAVACERVLHDYPQALELFKQALAVAPDSPLVEASLKDAIPRVEQSIAREKFKKEQDAANAMFFEVYALEDQKRHDEALKKIAEFAPRLSGSDRVQMLSRQWPILLEKGQVDAVLDSLKQVGEEEAANAEAQRTVGDFILTEKKLRNNPAAAALVSACVKRILDNPKAVRDDRMEAFLRDARAAGHKPAAH